MGSPCAASETWLRRFRHPILVAAGLVLVGAGSFASLGLAARGLSVEAFASFATWWTVANLLGLSFAVIEMYLPRVLIGAEASGRNSVVTTFSRGTLLVAAGASLLTISAGIVFGAQQGKESFRLAALAAVYLVLLAIQSLQRAVAVAGLRFGVFTIQMGVDGIVRGGLCAVALQAGAELASTFALMVCVGAGAGVISGGLANRDAFRLRGNAAPVELLPLALLFAASVGPLVVNNAGIPWLQTTEVTPRVVGAVAGALTLSRIPTLLVGAAYGPVLAPLSAAVVQSDRARFQALFRFAYLAAAGFAVVFSLLAALFGPAALSAYLGPDYTLDRLYVVLLAAGSGLMFVCVIEQAALVALTAWHRVAAGWVLGVLAFAAALVWPWGLEPTEQVSSAVLLGPLTAALAMGIGRRRVEGRMWRSTPSQL